MAIFVNLHTISKVMNTQEIFFFSIICANFHFKKLVDVHDNR